MIETICGCLTCVKYSNRIRGPMSVAFAYFPKICFIFYWYFLINTFSIVSIRWITLWHYSDVSTYCRPTSHCIVATPTPTDYYYLNYWCLDHKIGRVDGRLPDCSLSRDLCWAAPATTRSLFTIDSEKNSNVRHWIYLNGISPNLIMVFLWIMPFY